MAMCLKRAISSRNFALHLLGSSNNSVFQTRSASHSAAVFSDYPLRNSVTHKTPSFPLFNFFADGRRRRGFATGGESANKIEAVAVGPVESRGLYEEDEDDNDSKNIVLFHTGGLSCNQWRKLKNLCSPGGRILFRPNTYGKGKKKRFFKQLDRSAGPTCILYLSEEASNKHELLSSLESVDQDLLLLYGQHRSTLLDHKSVEKASSFDGTEASLFDFYLPAAYLSYLCSGV